MILAMFAMVMLTMVVGVFSFLAKKSSVESKAVAINDFVLMDGKNLPESIIKTTRNLNNQFEVPTLFYAGCLAYLALGITSTAGLIFAWAFVISRILHAYIHITYNKLSHRMLAFSMCLLMVIALWINLLLVSW